MASRLSADEPPRATGATATPARTRSTPALLEGLFDALRASSEVAGFCYTQFMDTGQETNGLLFEDGTPKIPVEMIREIVTGEMGASSASSSTVGWPD